MTGEKHSLFLLTVLVGFNPVWDIIDIVTHKNNWLDSYAGPQFRYYKNILISD